jgi:predicted transcriptional regulator
VQYLGLILQLIRNIFKAKTKLIIENLALRQQLAILNMKVKHRKINCFDRIFWITLSKFYSKWKNSLVIVQPETVIKWHRKLFKIYCTRKSRNHKSPGRPKVSKEIQKLIDKLTRENIHGEHQEY